MTAETDLLPLPPLWICPNVEPDDFPEVAKALIDYARANVAHATAPLQAEIEALRAEVERANSWNERVSVCRDHVADIVDGPCVICALDAAEARAERLAEVVRGWWKARRPVGWTEDQHRSCPHVNLATDAEKALATALLRDQEEGK